MTKIFYEFFDKSISTFKHVISKKKHKKSKEKKKIYVEKHCNNI
jgi:hypothetical protein